MSLFLGKIHFWLFDKIKCFENLEDEIIKFAKMKNANIDIKNIYETIGTKLEEKPLEEMIDTSNIHGWLQDKIQKAERRQAYLIKSLKEIDENYINELEKVFENHGSTIGKKINIPDVTPKLAYESLNNFMLEGMPCDRTTDFVEDSETKFSYVHIRCLHKKYWDEFNADIKDFYKLRNKWNNGFVYSLDNRLCFCVDEKDSSYINIDENTFSIVKK